MDRRTCRPWSSALPALLLLTVLALLPHQQATQPVTWLGPIGTAPNKDVVPPDMASAVRAGLTATRWPPAAAAAASLAAPEWAVDRCLNVGPRNASTCIYGPRDGRRRVALLGDSVAVSWLSGLREAAEREGWRIHVLTRQQCPAAAVRGGATTSVSPACAAHQRWAVEQVLRLQPEIVVMSGRYRGSATPGQWFSGLAVTLHRLAPAAATRTVVLAPSPDTRDVGQCMEQRLVPAQCVQRVSAHYLAYADHERKAARLYGARFVDTRSWSCLRNVCPAVVHGVPVHADGRHLTAPYARMLRAHLEDALEP